MTLKELEDELKEFRAKGAYDSTRIRFATDYQKPEAALLSLYYSRTEIDEGDIWFDLLIKSLKP